MSVEVGGRRIAYVAVEAFVMGEWMIAICVEGDKDGYRPILDYGANKKKEVVEQLAKHLNTTIGLEDDREIAKIVLSTMDFGRYKKGRKR